MIDERDFGVGVPVLYAPEHVQEMYKGGLVEDYLESPDTEIGFISSWRPGVVFCRFFWKRTQALRTTANSEGCSPSDLFLYTYFPQDVVEYTLHILRSNPDFYGWVEQGKVEDV